MFTKCELEKILRDVRTLSGKKPLHCRAVMLYWKTANRMGDYMKEADYTLKRDTLVLARFKDSGRYLMTNGDEQGRGKLAVFESDLTGNITMKGTLPRKAAEHISELSDNLEPVNRSLGELNPEPFGR